MADSFDERAFIAEVERATPQHYADVLRRATASQERVLRAWLGEETYRRQRDLALIGSIRGRRAVTEPRNVVVIHGIMGGELTSHFGGASKLLWASLVRIATGKLASLGLSEDGLRDGDPTAEIRASGIMKRYYGDLILRLHAGWNVHTFWFDWRKDVALAAAELEVAINNQFGKDAPVHIVAHSMGGLVARAFIRDHARRWAAGGRLIMLGTPNHGSFCIPQVLTGQEDLVRKLALVDLRHSVDELVEVFNTFVGTYQMLPSPFRVKDIDWLYDAKKYGAVRVTQKRLDAAREFHRSLLGVVDRERMIYVAGCDQPTPGGLAFRKGWTSSLDAYELTRAGDGRVTHELGLLDGVPTYYVPESHGDLTTNAAVLAALDDLLELGEVDDSGVGGGLSKEPTARRGRRESQASLREELRARRQRDEAELEERAARLQTRAVQRGDAGPVSADEQRITDVVLRGYLGSRADVASALRGPEVAETAQRAARLKVRVVHGGIESAHELRAGGREPEVDAVAVGHYLGVRPTRAEEALDRALSAPLLERRNGRGGSRRRLDPRKIRDVDLLLTSLTDRGVLRGELGQPFFLNDPRRSRGRSADRVIAIAGMGLPGRFAAPELTVLVRELLWSLGRLGKRHLASVLIGSGNGNLAIPVALQSWLRGITAACDTTDDDADGAGTACVSAITLVENDAGRVLEMEASLASLVEDPRWSGQIEHVHLSRARLTALRARYQRDQMQKARRRWNGATLQAGSDSERMLAPQLTVELTPRDFRVGAITATASIPERRIPIDRKLVLRANDELAAESNPPRQLERGRLLGQLLVPADLRDFLQGGQPVVLQLDSTTAQLHWEMVAMPPRRAGSGREWLLEQFFGTGAGVSRQLRTAFAPPPESPPPPRRLLRVLIIADPAEDNPLEGAAAEGAELAELLEAFNGIYAREGKSIAIKRLIGRDATRTNVMRELTQQPYDLLHFAGHAFYDAEDPQASGWVFSGGEVLSANELQRIDRVPKLVFSNACESGKTPDRADERSAGLAPSFAEAFFARGVSNFVCTAWPVDDSAARIFSRRFYCGLLGLRCESAKASPRGARAGAKRGGDGDAAANATAAPRYAAGIPENLFQTMREARRAIALSSYGAGTWGAYQHYGDPFFRLFYEQPER